MLDLAIPAGGGFSYAFEKDKLVRLLSMEHCSNDSMIVLLVMLQHQPMRSNNARLNKAFSNKPS